MIYYDPNGYFFKKFGKWLNKQWNDGWDALNQFATWADKTDRFPSSGGAGINSAGNTWHYLGNSGNIYHNQLGNDYGGVVNAAINDARGSVSFVNESSLMNVAANSGGDWHPPMALKEVGSAVSYASGAIGLTQIGMLEYRMSLPIMSKIGTFGTFSSTYRGLGVASKTLGRTATYIGAPLSIGLDYSAYRSGNISLGRFGYRTGSLGVSIGTGAAIGGPWGAAAGAGVGGISAGTEYIYDNFLVPLGNEIQYQIWNFENAIRNGWYPGR